LTKESNKSSFKWIRIALYLILVLIFIFILLSFALTRPKVQNWAVDLATEELSERLNAQISIDSISFDVRRGVKIWDVTVLDAEGDTLVAGSEIASSLTNNLTSLWKNELFIEDIYLHNIYLNIEKNEPDLLTNWQQLFANLNQDAQNDGKVSEPLLLSVKSLELDQVHLRHKTEFKERNIKLPKGSIHFESIDLDSLIFHVSKIEFNKPDILVVNQQKPTIQDSEETKEKTGKTISPNIQIDKLLINEGYVRTVMDPVVRDQNQIDYANLDLKNLNLNVENLVLENGDIKAKLENLSGLLDDKLPLEQTSVSEFAITNRKIIVNDFVLRTKNTSIASTNSLKFKSFDDFQNFEDKVFMDVEFDNSVVSLKEIAYLIPGLSKSPLIQKNVNETIEIDGRIKGRVNNFTSQDLIIKVSDKIKFEGKLRVRNIVKPEEALIVIEVDKLNSSINNLTEVIPNFKPPTNFYKLGQVDFSGRFEGFIYNFVAYGQLGTALGAVKTDMQLDLTRGRDNAKYSGDIDLIEFDLAKWSDNPEFNKVSFSSSVKNGSGLTLNNAKAVLDAKIQQFSFRGHNYEDVFINGKLEKNQFDGEFHIDDPFVAMDFDGSFIFEDNLIKGDFNADIDKLDLYSLKISKDTVLLSGNVDVVLEGSNIDDFKGEANLDEVEITLGGRTTKLDSIYIMSSPETNNERVLLLESDLVNLIMEGKFNFTSMVDDAKTILVEEHPAWAEYLGLEHKGISDKQDFRFRLNIVDSENLFTFLGLPDLSISGLQTVGLANSIDKKMSVGLGLDSLSYKNYAVNNTELNLESNSLITNLNFETDAILVENRTIEKFDIDAVLEGDVLKLEVDSGNLLDTLGYLDFAVNVEPVDKKLEIHFEENEWEMMGTQWSFDKNNKIVFGKEYIDVQNFLLKDGERSIELKSNNFRDLMLRVADVDVALLNPFLDMPNLQFSGSSFVNVEVDDIFKERSIFGSFVMPDLAVNGESYGAMNAFIQPEANKDILRLDATISREADGQTVALNTTFNTVNNEISGKLDADNFQFKFFEFIIKNGISDTGGHFDLNCDIKGTLSNIRLRGTGLTHKGQVKVDYLSNTFYFDQQEIRINEKVIDVTGGKIADKFGNEAVLTGGLYHEYLKDFNLNLNISGDEFLILNTTKKDNNAYYGTGFGQGSITFTGPFEKTDIVINATTGPGTILNIPVEASKEGADESFIEFVEKGKLLEVAHDTVAIQEFIAEGVNVEMNITITPDAKIRIIFDEQLNDVIEGQGRGNIRLISARTGAFDVFGQYTVEQGKYLFTALGIVAKPFEVKRGGTIVWTGDPLNATLNIEAEYDGLETSTLAFLEEYFASGNEDQYQEARQKTDVLLSVLLTGTLFKPEINFDIKFPELQGELRSFADNKMRILRSNPTDLNDQVAGLLIFGSFLPSNNPGILSSNSFLQSGYNTLSEFVSNQLSYLLSGMLEEALIDNGLVTGIDFEIGFSKNAEFGEFESAGFLPDEVEVHFKPKFRNDRWNVDLGTNYVRESTIGISNYVFYDFVLEYALTSDRRLKLKIYGKNDYDAIEAQRELKYGAGIRYRKEFGTLSEFKEVFKKQIDADLNTGSN